jgi:hypothetical protein
MEPTLRWLVFVAGGLLAAGFASVLLVHADLPTTKLEINGEGAIAISIPALAVILLSFGLAWCYALTATLYAHPVLRGAVLAGFTAAMLDQGTGFSPLLHTGRAAILLAGLIVLCLMIGAYTLRARQSNKAPLGSKVQKLSACAVFASTAAVQLAAWWASRAANVAGVFTLGFVLEITVFALLAVLFIASSGGSFAQVADLISSNASKVVDQSRARYLLVAVALAGGLATRAATYDSVSLAKNAALAVSATIVVCALAWRQREQLASIRRLPSWATILTGALIAGTLTLSSALVRPSELSPSNTPVGYVCVIALGLAALLGAVLTVVKPRPLIAASVLCMLLGVLLAGLVNLREGVALLAGHTVAGLPHINLSSVEVTLAIMLGALVAAGVLTGGSVKASARAALPLVVILAATVFLLDPLFNLYADAAENVITAGEIAFLLAMLAWEVAFSGDITNSDGRLVQRPGRVLMYLGFMLAVSAAVVYFSSGHGLGKLRVEENFDPAANTTYSIIFVGVSYAVVTCFARLAAAQGATPLRSIGRDEQRRPESRAGSAIQP